MLGKKLLWSALAISFLMSTGCCRMWENWCHRPNHYQPAAPYCAPAAQPQCVCPPNPCYASPAPAGYAAPVPNAAGGPWQRCP